MEDRADRDSGQATVQAMALDSGARLEVIDASRPLTGDRWRVEAIVRLTIPVSEEILGGDEPGAGLQEVRQRLGAQVSFEKRLERTFVAADQKAGCFREMVEGYLKRAAGYLSRPAFARSYVRRRYAEEVKKAAWYQ